MNGIVVPLAAFLLSLAALRLSSGQASAAAFKEGPYPNVTGGFGEQSCRLCHLDNPLNAPGGQLTLAGVPPIFTPGSVYPITVTIAREDMRRGGFEIAARFAGGRQKGRQAGTWKLTDARTQLIPGAVDKALTFVQHNLAGSRAATAGANTWTIEWTAPAEASAPVQFNVAANASNNDDSPLGDYIYLKSARSSPAKPTPHR
jgi:Reeler domain